MTSLEFIGRIATFDAILAVFREDDPNIKVYDLRDDQMQMDADFGFQAIRGFNIFDVCVDQDYKDLLPDAMIAKRFLTFLTSKSFVRQTPDELALCETHSNYDHCRNFDGEEKAAIFRLKEDLLAQYRVDWRISNERRPAPPPPEPRRTFGEMANESAAAVLRQVMENRPQRPRLFPRR